MATQATLNYWVKIISCSSFLRNNWAKSLRYFEGISVFKINDGGWKKKNIFFWKQKWEGRLEFRNHKACMLYASSNLVRLWTLLLTFWVNFLCFLFFFFHLLSFSYTKNKKKTKQKYLLSESHWLQAYNV